MHLYAALYLDFAAQQHAAISEDCLTVAQLVIPLGSGGFLELACRLDFEVPSDF